MSLLISLHFFSGSASCHELSGNVAVEGRFFFHDPLYEDQKKDNGSLSVQPEYYHQLDNGAAFTFVPFARIDNADEERTHADIRELNLLWPGDFWEVRLGIGKVFWGVTEFLHLVDIINQTDLVEDIDGEDKLGQPMVKLSLIQDWGVADLFILPYFRERTFPGKKGRLRTALIVDTDKAEYESGAEEHHVDLALRYSHTIGDYDFGIYHFKGTGREPTLLPGVNNRLEPVLIPFYDQIDQTGLEVQRVAGSWLLKLEAIYRTGQGDAYFSCTGGFEYTFTRFLDTRTDLGIIGEAAYDERRNDAPGYLEDDVMFGLRLALNDVASTELLLGATQDLDDQTRSFSLEASRRLGNSWRLSIVSRLFYDPPQNDPFAAIRDDDYIQIELAYYY